MRCGYFEAGSCRSCTLIQQPYAVQLIGKQEQVAQVLADHVVPERWEEPVASREAGFRNKAKMVVAGTSAAPTLGILDAGGAGTDLRACGLHEPVVAAAMEPLAAMVTRAGLTPYDVGSRRGELKNLLVTGSPDGELMVRFVLRSTEALPRLRKHLPWLLEQLPHLRVITANLQPAPKAVLEGEQEVMLGKHETMSMRVAGLDLQLRPQGFFQTNSEIAGRLYDQARTWVAALGPEGPGSVWDLYCGVGGFALALAGADREVLGIEVSAEAVQGAREGARRLGADRVGFETGDATTYLGERPAPDLVVVNPPRRGIGELAPWLEASGVHRVLYSSCEVSTLARDLAGMPSLEVVAARLFDMFPQSRHQEVMVLLERRA